MILTYSDSKNAHVHKYENEQVRKIKNTRSTYKNQFYFHILAMNNAKTN